jgi:hydroxypyruvate reductase
MPINFTHLEPEYGKYINAIIQSALEAADPFKSVISSIIIEKDHLEICGQSYDLRKIDRILVVGMGKAVGAMAAAVTDRLGEAIHSGVIVAKHEVTQHDISPRIKIVYGDHPIPSDRSIASADSVIDFLKESTDDDLIICLISGGGSALVAKPINGITITELQQLTDALLKSGARIQEVNTIRKHIDAIKGGGLAKIAGNATMEALIVSDVLGDDLSMIASGPTCGDETTYAEAFSILDKYGLIEKTPQKIIDTIEAGILGRIAETLKPGDKILATKQNHIIASLTASIQQAKKKANELGFETQILSTHLVGEAREIGHVAGSILRSLAKTDLILKKPAMMIAGGESTVTIKGDGMGGRNQEIAFGAMPEISGCEKCALIALATDGEDGPTDAAGAYVTGATWDLAIKLGLVAQQFGSRNDTNTFFCAIDHLIMTGPTGTNVNDLMFLIAF